MNNLQNKIIQNTSLKTNYLLVNNLKRLNLRLSLNANKSTLTSNVKYTHINSLKITNSQTNNLFINEKINSPTFIFKLKYSQTSDDNSNDNNVKEEVETGKNNNEIPNDTKKETTNESSNNSGNKNNNESEENTDKANIYSIVVGLIAISTAGAMKVQKKIIEKKLEDLENETQIKIEGSPLMKFYAMLPLRILSRFAGKLMNITIPEKYREKIYKSYAKSFGCHLDEMLDEDLTHYKSIAQFFYRRIKPSVRPINKNVDLVSPVDGRVLQFGEIINNEIEQVKGFTYSVQALLGYDGNSKKEKVFEFDRKKLIKSMHRHPSHVNMSHQKFLETYSIQSTQELEKLGKNQRNRFVRNGNKLLYCVLYLSPGDYHHFHSPTNWIIEKRRHFSGHLLSVSPKIVNLVHNLFTVNERVALIGRWKHGFFSMVPVGATNVGSVVLTLEDKLKTNRPYRKQVVKRKAVKYGVYTERSYANVSPLLKGIPVHRGEELGGFQMGSTVVLVFEAPKTFKFNIKPSQKICVGEAISQ